MKIRTTHARAVLTAAAFIACASIAFGQAESTIEMDPPIECWYHDAFPQLEAGIAPSGDVAQMRLYFRCMLFPDYYFVDLDPTADGFMGVAPKAEETCNEVSYYVEAVRSDFTSTRTEERIADVTSLNQCRRRNPGVLFFGGEPSLIVGTTSPGVTELLGFSTERVIQFVTATGNTIALGAGATGGGGLGGGAIAGIAAGGAGAAAAIAAASGGESDPPPDLGPPTGGGPAPATTTIPPTTTIPAASPVMACFDIGRGLTDTIRAGQQIELDARCSTGDNLTFSWDLGDGRAPREGAFIRPTFNRPGVYTITLTVTQPDSGLRVSAAADIVDTESKTLTVVEGAVACFDVKTLSPGSYPCEMQFNGSCSTGDLVRWDWLLDENGVFGGPFPASGAVVSKNFAGFCMPPPTIRVRLTVTDSEGFSDTTTRSVVVRYLTSPFQDGQRISTRFTSFLGVRPFDGQTMGQVHHNETQVDLVTNAGTKEHNLKGRYGANRVEAHTTTPLTEPGHWRFDFSTAPDFVPGSIQVQSGEVLSASGREIVFRLSGRAGERIKFTYQLVP